MNQNVKIEDRFSTLRPSESYDALRYFAKSYLCYGVWVLEEMGECYSRSPFVAHELDLQPTRSHNSASRKEVKAVARSDWFNARKASDFMVSKCFGTFASQAFLIPATCLSATTGATMAK